MGMTDEVKFIISLYIIYVTYFYETALCRALHFACCGDFYKLLYLTSFLNAHNHNTYIRLPQTGCTARKMALFIISQDRQTQVLAANAVATTIIIDYNS